ncbi:hypothetical protein [Halorubrum tropicale]|uniref:Uncharacterized protein n=1 Tax=Halorubrum tropicale TaxID=1765655 RepID=A0A0M9ANV4_9EURY|nr:hypothetical protein [Halorubrum tropicale]KOX95762.1 hypothetical protein AMR74_12540 [Halorubrum tropicale]
MALRPNGRLGGALLAVCCGLLAPLISEQVLAHRLGLAGPPVAYGFLALAGVGAVAAFRYSSADSWRYLLAYAGLAVAVALGTFAYLLGQAGA